MKPSPSLRHFLCISSSALLAATSAHAATLYWDGGTVNIGSSPNGNGVSGGTLGNWDTTLTNWDQGNALTHIAWNNASNDIASFGGTAGAVTLTAPITVGGLTFFSNSGYTIAGSTLTFGAANNTIALLAQTGTTSSATITSSLVGTGNVILTSISPTVASTLNLNAGVGTGWSGTTTINAGMTLAMTGDGTGANGGRALANSTGITLNGGAIAITNDNSSSSQRATTRVSDSAVITSNGGTISLAISTTNSAAPVSETYGSVALTTGQLNVTLSSGRTASSTSIVLSDLTRSGASNTSAVAFARAGTAGGTNIIRVNSVVTDTTAGQIIGSWATTGNTASQSDYAVYSGLNGTVIGAGISASNQSTWTTAANAYTADASLGTGAITLSGGTKNITALRSTTASSAVTATNATDVINLAAHTYVNGDAFVFNSGTAPTGLTAFTPYFVVNAAANTFQLSATQGGGAINFTTDGTGLTGIGALLVSSGNNLGTTGILNGSSNTMYIAATGSGVVTLPTTIADNLHVNAGAGPVVIYAPIADNTGALTLVKNGSQALTLSGANTYTGGTVVNAGQLNWTANTNLGAAAADRDITVNGIANLNGQDGTSLDALAVGSGGLANFITGSYTFATTTGTGVISYRPTVINKTLNLGNASGFTGTVQASMGAVSNAAPNVQFSSLGDGVSSALQFTGGSLDGGQTASFTLNGTSPLVFNNRQIQILPRISNNHGVLQNNLTNNSALVANTWVINTALLVDTNQTGRNLNLRGTNTGANAFNGLISDGNSGGSINLTKQDAGTWTASNNNTFSGTVSVSGGTLALTGLNSYVGTTSISGGGTLSANTIKNFTETSSLGAAASGSIIIGSTNTNGTLLYTGAGNTSNRTIQIGANSGAPVVGDTGGATIQNDGGSGALTFNATNFNTATNAASGTSPTRTLTLQGANLGANTISGKIVNNQIAGSPTAAVAVTKSGAGTWALTGANEYTGGTRVNAGILSVNTIADSGTSALGTTGTLTLAGGTLSYTGAADTTTARAVTLLANSTIDLADGDLNLSGTSSGAFILNKSGTGTLILSGATDNSGLRLNVSQGEVHLGKNAVANIRAVAGIAGISSGATVKLIGPSTDQIFGGNNSILYGVNGLAGTLDINGISETVSFLNGTSTGVVNNTSATAASFQVGQSDVSSSFAGVIQNTGGGALSLLKTGSGTQTLTGASTYSGATAIHNGVVVVSGGNNRLTSTTAVTLGFTTFNGRLQLGDSGSISDQTVSSLTTSGSGTTNAVVGGNASVSTLTINNGSAVTYSGTLGGAAANQNNLALTKSGAGKLILSGTSTHTYTGATAVNAGTLEIASGVSSAAGSAVTVSNSGSALVVNGTVNGMLVANASTTLSGTGTVNGAATINGNHNPGSSPGIQTFTNGLTYGSTATLNAEFVGNTLGLRGTDYDGVDVTGGNLSINALATLSLYATSIDYTAAVWNGSRDFTVIDYSGGGTSTGVFQLVTTNAGSFGSEGSWSLANTSNDIILSWTPVPEPRAALLGGLGVLMLLRRRR